MLFRRSTLVLAVLLLCFVSANAAGQAQGNPDHIQGSGDDIPGELRDRGFDRFVDLELLRTALRELNAELLTDIALQAVNGEKVLMRSHKAFSADDLFGVATRLAGQQQDSATLQRLSKAVQVHGRPNLQAQIDLARSLVIKLRLESNATEAGSKSLTIVRPLVREIKRAGALGDTGWLQALQRDVETINGLTRSERDHLSEMINGSLKTIAESDGSASSTLARLAGFRRSAPSPP